jgi:hypothetical protein
MYRVVFLSEPADSSWFGSVVDTLNQGASIEGVYNGWVHGNEYRILENEAKIAPPRAVSLFARELALIESEMEKARVFTPEDARAPALTGLEEGHRMPGRRAESAEAPSGQASSAPSESVFGKPLSGEALTQKTNSRLDPSSLVPRYEQAFLGANLFTLKRILGEEALRLIEQKERKTGALIDWYGAWAVALAERKIDFGVPQRNLADFDFHKSWAAKAERDRLVWEVLNRLHRVVNSSLSSGS